MNPHAGSAGILRSPQILQSKQQRPRRHGEVFRHALTVPAATLPGRLDLFGGKVRRLADAWALVDAPIQRRRRNAEKARRSADAPFRLLQSFEQLVLTNVSGGSFGWCLLARGRFRRRVFACPLGDQVLQAVGDANFRAPQVGGDELADDVAQLPHVARPVPGRKTGDERRRHPRRIVRVVRRIEPVRLVRR